MTWESSLHLINPGACGDLGDDSEGKQISAISNQIMLNPAGVSPIVRDFVPIGVAYF